jgi:hypothetical protein
MVLSVIEGGLTKAAAALRFNVTAKTVAKWWDGSARRAQMDCETAHQGPIPCQAKQRLPPAR